MSAASIGTAGGPPGRQPLQYLDGSLSQHWQAQLLARIQLQKIFPNIKSEPRNLSRYANNDDIDIDYPAQAHLVADFLAARTEAHATNVYVWDIWPASTTTPPPSLLELVSSRIADLAAATEFTKVSLGSEIEPAAWYFPESSIGLGGYWLSVFTAEDWSQYGPPDRDPYTGCTGIIFYQEIFDPNPGPFQIDNPMPSPIQVPAPGVYPPKPEGAIHRPESNAAERADW